MPGPPPTPLAGHAILLLPGRRRGAAELAVADLHLGLGYTGREGLGLAERSAREMASEILSVAAARAASGVVVVGDVKHSIVGAPAPVGRLIFEFFSTLLGEGLAVRVIAGNHDIGLARHLPREVELLGPVGSRRAGVGLFHGHAWPSAAVLAAPVLVAGHLHPGYRFASAAASATSKERCWVRATFDAPVGRGSHRIRAREIIVLPAFNPLAGIESLNKHAPRRIRSFLVHRFLNRGKGRAYLLDGTDLGALPTWADG